MLRKILIRMGQALLAWALCMFMLLVAVDALELETTGECKECVILSR